MRLFTSIPLSIHRIRFLVAKACLIKSKRLDFFRHHFAWANLNRWAADGLDLNVMLAYLMRYMGHQSVSGTLYYFRFVPEFFPVFREMTENLEDILPEVPDEE